MRYVYSTSRHVGRAFAWWLSLCLTLAFCAGCRRSEESNRNEAPELIVGAGTDVAVSGAFQARLGVYPLNVNVAEPLVRLSPDYKVEPSLATSWEYRGQNTWRFFLRRGVRFHNGQEFTARAVEWSIEQYAKGNVGYSFLTEESVKIVDDYTVDITPSKPNIPLPQQLVHPNYSIFASDTDPAVKPIGTGAFQMIEYRPNERIVVMRHESYWGEKARLPRITFRFIPDATTRVLALQAGEVDLIVDLPREQAAQIAAQPNLTVARSPVGLIMSLQLNIHGAEPHTLLTERLLRQALGYAIDRQTLIQKVWEGEGSEAQNMTAPAILGVYAAQVKGFAFNQNKAAELLEASGWSVGADGIREKNERKLQLIFLANPDIDAGTVEFIQAQLKQVGIDAKWNKLPDVGSYAARQNDGEFDINLSISNQNDANPLFLPALIYYSKSSRPFTRWYYVGEKFDRLIEIGLQSSNPDDVQRIAAESIHVAIDEEAALIPIAGLFRLYAHKRTVEGFVPHPSSTNQSWSQIFLK
ncbi:MAG: ABC transporter substrate-binding protein [Pyrinomonadaceae bacterium]|nr:ABC transporter substrate-binding protein [Pyrinomonadaceae bacterium]